VFYRCHLFRAAILACLSTATLCFW
jgi:hypothetical protein